MSIQQAIITLVSAMISGVVATIVTLMVSSHKENVKIKKDLVDDIFGYRYQIANNSNNAQINLDINQNQFSRAMNRIPIVFDGNNAVMSAYDKFYDTLTITDAKERSFKSDEALIDLLKELCKAAGIKCSNWNDSRFKRTFSVQK